MSLPKMHQSISENPDKNAVTAPSDPRNQELDVDRKMRLYGVIQGFRNGNLPSNQQIDYALDSFVNTAPFETKKLSKEGQELIDGFRKVVLTAKKLLLTKNQDEIIQDFVYHTTKFDGQAHAQNIKAVSAPVDQSTAESEGQQALEHLRVLAKLVFTNSEVRKLLSDVSVLGRDVVADAAANLSEKARPDEHDLKRADEPAPDAQWIAPDGSKRGPNESVPDTGVGEKVEQAKQKKDEVVNQAQNEAQKQADQTQNRVQREGATNDSEKQKQIAKEEGSNAVGRAQNLLKSHGVDPQEHKERVKANAAEQKDKAVDYLKDKFPEERRDRFIYRLKKVLYEQQQHDDYNNAIEFFLDLTKRYKRRAADVANQGAGKGSDVRSDPAWQNAEMELRIILERFANNTSMQPIIDAIDQLYTDADNDPELRQWWSSANKYIRRILLEEGYVMEDQATEDGRKLRESGRRFWDHKYRGHREDLFESVEDFFHAYNEDPLNKQLGVEIKNLVKSLVLDKNGSLTYKSHLISDLRHIIIPAVVESIGYVPIPRIEYTDKDFDIVVENLTVQLANLLPNMIEIEARNYFKLSQFDALGDYSQHGFTIGFTQVHADLRDVAFMFKKKKGFPKLSDSGLADIIISGKGMSGKIHLETTPNKHSLYKVADCTISIDELKFKIRDSKHNFLYNMVRATATGLIKNAVAKAIQAALRQALVQLDQQLTDIRDAANDGETIQERLESVRERVAQKKAKSDEKSAKAKQIKEDRQAEVNIVMTRDQEHVKWESPNSYVGKTGIAQKRAVGQGEHGWKSEVFDIWKPSPGLNKSIVNQDLKQK